MPDDAWFFTDVAGFSITDVNMSFSDFDEFCANDGTIKTNERNNVMNVFFMMVNN